MADNQFQESVYQRVKRRKRATVSSLNEACDAAVALHEENGKDVTIFIICPDENGDKDRRRRRGRSKKMMIQAVEKEENPGIFQEIC